MGPMCRRETARWRRSMTVTSSVASAIGGCAAKNASCALADLAHRARTISSFGSTRHGRAFRGNNDLNERAWVGISHMQLSTQLPGPPLHPLEADTKAGRMQLCDLLFDSLAIVTYRNDNATVALNHCDPRLAGSR